MARIRAVPPSRRCEISSLPVPGSGRRDREQLPQPPATRVSGHSLSSQPNHLICIFDLAKQNRDGAKAPADTPSSIPEQHFPPFSASIQGIAGERDEKADRGKVIDAGGEGNCIWKLQSEDGAQNEGGWRPARVLVRETDPSPRKQENDQVTTRFKPCCR